MFAKLRYTIIISIRHYITAMWEREREKEANKWETASRGTLCSFWLLDSNARVSYLHQVSHLQRHAALRRAWFMANAVERPREPSARIKHSSTLNGTVYVMNTPDKHWDARSNDPQSCCAAQTQLWGKLMDIKEESEVLQTAVWCHSVI